MPNSPQTVLFLLLYNTTNLTFSLRCFLFRLLSALPESAELAVDKEPLFQSQELAVPLLEMDHFLNCELEELLRLLELRRIPDFVADVVVFNPEVGVLQQGRHLLQRKRSRNSRRNSVFTTEYTTGFAIEFATIKIKKKRKMKGMYSYLRMLGINGASNRYRFSGNIVSAKMRTTGVRSFMARSFCAILAKISLCLSRLPVQLLRQ